MLKEDFKGTFEADSAAPAGVYCGALGKDLAKGHLGTVICVSNVHVVHSKAPSEDQQARDTLISDLEVLHSVINAKKYNNIHASFDKTDVEKAASHLLQH